MVWNKKVLLNLLAALLLFSGATHGGRPHPESYYQNAWCAEKNGTPEYVLPDQTRCDCLTRTHAVEVDFAPKFYQAIGQALYYGAKTGKKAGIVLIIEDQKNQRYWRRLNAIIKHYRLPIDTWAINSAK